MQQIRPSRVFPAGAALVAVLVMPARMEAQTVSGSARVVQVTSGGTPTAVLADTGPLTDASDARETSAVAGAVGSVIQGETLHAVTLGWPDQAESEASITDLTVTVNGTTITASLVLSRVGAAQGQESTGAVEIDGLSINGSPVSVSGAPNQTVAISGGRVVINERVTASGASVVNGLHVIAGDSDVVIASVSAGIR
jgi:hypothetical protein